MAETDKDEPVPVAVKSINLNDWVKLMLGGGFAIVVGWAAFKYVLTEGSTNSEFQRNTVRETTAALTSTAGELRGMRDSLDGLVDKQSDLITELHPLTRNLDRLIDSVNAQVEQQQTVIEAAKEEAAK